MARDRIVLRNRLHLAAAHPEGLAEVKYLVEEEKVDVNQLHTEIGVSPLVFAVQSGSLATIQYLLDAKANVTQPENNLLSIAQASKRPGEITNFVASLYKQFNDGTTELHAAVLSEDVSKIEMLLNTNSMLVYAKDRSGATPQDFAVTKASLKIAGMILIKADQTHEYYSKSLEAFALRFAELAEDDKIANKIILSKLIDRIKSAEDIRIQCCYFILSIIINLIATPTDNLYVSKFIRVLHLKILESKSGIESFQLAVAIPALIWKTRNKIITHEPKLREIALRLLPEVYLHHFAEFFYSYLVSNIHAKKNSSYILKGSERAQALLDAKPQIALLKSRDLSTMWFDNIISVLNYPKSDKDALLLTMCLRLGLRIAPGDSAADKDFIAKLTFRLARNYLKLRMYEEAKRIFSQCELEYGQELTDETTDDLILTTMMFAVENNYDAITHALRYVSLTQFKDRLHHLVSDYEDVRENLLPLLKALHAKGIMDMLLPNTLIASRPLLMYLASAKNYEAIRFYFENISVMTDEQVLSTDSSVEIQRNCTILYHVGIQGDLVEFRYLFDKIPKLYHPEITGTTIPFIFALLESTKRNLSQLAAYYKILEMVLNKFPDELNQTWREMTVKTYVEDCSQTIKGLFGPLLVPRKHLFQAELSAQIRCEILSKKTIRQVLKGAVVLSGKCFYENSPDAEEIDPGTVLRENIEMLSGLISPYVNEGPMQVTEKFFNEEFLPWKLMNETQLQFYTDAGLPAVEAKNGSELVKDINKVISLIRHYMSRSLKTTFLKTQASGDLLYYIDTAETKDAPYVEKRILAESTSVEVKDTFHPASAAFLLFHNREYKLENIEEQKGANLHPAHRT